MALKRILFLGSDDISKICLETIYKAYPYYQFNVISTSEDSPPAYFGYQNKMNVYHESGGKMEDWKLLKRPSPIFDYYFEYMIVASFGYLIPKTLLSVCRRSLNMHPSLLPKYRGASPIQYTIFNKEPKAGVSIIDIHPDVFDKGKIIAQEELKNHDMTNTTFETLSTSLAKLGGELLVKVINDYEFYDKSSWFQDEDLVTKAPKIYPAFSKLDFYDKTEDVYARFRALRGTGINPHFFFRGKRWIPLKMRRLTAEEWKIVHERYPQAVPRSVWIIYPGLYQKKKKSKFIAKCDNILYIKTDDGWIALEDAIVEGIPKNLLALKIFMGDNINQVLFQEPILLEKRTGEDLLFE